MPIPLRAENMRDVKQGEWKTINVCRYCGEGFSLNLADRYCSACGILGMESFKRSRFGNKLTDLQLVVRKKPRVRKKTPEQRRADIQKRLEQEQLLDSLHEEEKRILEELEDDLHVNVIFKKAKLSLLDLSNRVKEGIDKTKPGTHAHIRYCNLYDSLLLSRRKLTKKDEGGGGKAQIPTHAIVQLITNIVGKTVKGLRPKIREEVLEMFKEENVIDGVYQELVEGLEGKKEGK